MRSALACRDSGGWHDFETPLTHQMQPSFIDLCCGCGGFTQGLVDAGLRHVGGYDIDQAALRTYNANFLGLGYSSNIRNLHLPPGAADILVAGLPCQGHSTLGKRARWDGRNTLWSPFLRLVSEVQPRAGAVENVTPFLKSRACMRLARGLEALGYRVTMGAVSALDFGVPQRRKRAVLIFARPECGVTPGLPRPWSIRTSVRDAFVGLSTVPDGQNGHEERKHGELARRRFPHVPEGGTRLNLPEELLSPCWKRIGHGAATNSFGRLWWDRPADTLRTAFLKPETGRFIHPTAHRGLTIREGARLQGFPDHFAFLGGSEQRAAQIGNAVPPPVARAIGMEFQRLLAACALEEQACA